MLSLLELKKSSGAAVCIECGKCSAMCPLAPFGDFSAARMMSIQDPEAEIYGHADAVQRCLTCGSCEVRCPQGVRYTDFVRGLRQVLPPDARTSCPHGEVLQWAARMEGEPASPDRDLSWLGDDLAIAEQGELALFVGCLPLFDATFARGYGVDVLEITRAAIRLLNGLGIEPVVLGQERCCGHDLLWNGEQAGFEKLAAANAQAFGERGVKKILTTCAECCRTWRMDYPHVVPDFQPRVEHLSEFLAPMVARGELTFEPSAEGRLTYHDPCRLGRQLEVYDAPRALLGAVPGSELVEMDRARADSLCCGTSGFIHCDAASRGIQAQRLESAAATGASKLITACPKCLIHFHCAQAEDRRMGRPVAPLEIEDFTVFAASQVHLSSTAEIVPPSSLPMTGEGT